MCVGLWLSNISWTSCTSICAAWRKCWFFYSPDFSSCLCHKYPPPPPPHTFFHPKNKAIFTSSSSYHHYSKITEYLQWLHPWDFFFLPIPGLQGAIWEDAGIDRPRKGATGPWWAALDHELADVGAACQRPVPEQLTPRSMVSTRADLCVKLSWWCPPIAHHALVLFCHSDGRPLFIAVGLWHFFCPSRSITLWIDYVCAVMKAFSLQIIFSFVDLNRICPNVVFISFYQFYSILWSLSTSQVKGEMK